MGGGEWAETSDLTGRALFSHDRKIFKLLYYIIYIRIIKHTMKLNKKLELSENQFRILDLFTRGVGKEYYVREMGKLLSVSPRTSQLNLEELERAGVLEAATRGKIKLYRLRNNEIAKEYIKLVEVFKKIRFLEKHELIREIVSKIDSHIDGIGIIFGSYAKGIEKKNSDLDIFIAGSYKRKEFEKISKLFGVTISVKNYSLNVFEREFGKDILIKEMLNNRVVFHGIEKFAELLMKHG